MRANKIGFSGNVEIRCPFLDVNLVDMVMSIDPDLKMCDNTKPDGVHQKMEKWVLRTAFDTPEDPYLPEDVLWR